jgi:hypothetical protein
MKRRNLLKDGLTVLSALTALGVASCAKAFAANTEIQTTGNARFTRRHPTISGEQLPPPAPKLGDVIKENRPGCRSIFSYRLFDNVVTPQRGGSDWQLRFQVQFLFPK